MIYQDQYGRRRDLTISLPHNNMESICPSILWKGVCHTVETEAGKK